MRHSHEDSAATTKFIWDFENYLAETDADDEIQAVYTNEPQPYGNLISQYRKGPSLWLPSYYHYDALGSTRALTDDAGDVTDTYLYDAWGNELAVSGPTINPFRWVGRVGYSWDECTGTFYIRARVYEPVIGRWMSQDPILDTADGTLYSYVDADPINSLDASGLWGTIEGNPVAPVPQAAVDAACDPCYVYESFVMTPETLNRIAFCRCMTWVRKEQLRGGTWLMTLPACPCNIGAPPTNPNSTIWYDPERAHPSYHPPGQGHCIRSLPTAAGHGQQCCYDGIGRLITHGLGAGTPDFVSSDLSSVGNLVGHWFEDVKPFGDCGRVRLQGFYLAYRPPNNVLNCPRNP